MKWTILAMVAMTAAAQAQTDPFADGANGAKVHSASGFICPLQIGSFERDAVGERNPQTGADYCAYSALDGVYGTITLAPLPKTYDPVAMLAPDFVVQEGTGGRVVGDGLKTLGTKAAPLSVYTRSYETAKLEGSHYRTLFASAAVGAWAVDVTIEYAEPRYDEIKTAFLNAAYAAALAKLSP
jgi:hypothetical protein